MPPAHNKVHLINDVLAYSHHRLLSILQCLGQMRRLDLIAPRQVCYRSRQLKHPVIPLADKFICPIAALTKLSIPGYLNVGNQRGTLMR